MKKDSGISEGAMSFLDHLEELRWRLIKSLISVLVCGGAIYYYWRKIFEMLLAYPLHKLDPKPQLIFTTPTEAFIASLKIAFFGGLFIASPIVLYQIWRFVAPGLFKNERRFAIGMIFLSVICFAVGIFFSYIATPMTIRFLVEFRTASLAPFFSVNSYLSFIIKLTLAFGAVFQLPAASLILTRAGLITYRTLIDYWKIAIVVIFLLAAFITPPDVVSQTIMAIPLLALYLISIGISWMAGKKEESPIVES